MNFKKKYRIWIQTHICSLYELNLKQCKLVILCKVIYCKIGDSGIKDQGTCLIF